MRGGSIIALITLLSEGLRPGPAFDILFADLGVLLGGGTGLDTGAATGGFANGIVVVTDFADASREVVNESWEWSPDSSLLGVPVGPAPFDLDLGGMGGLWAGFWDAMTVGIPWVGAEILAGGGTGIRESKV